MVKKVAVVVMGWLMVSQVAGASEKDLIRLAHDNRAFAVDLYQKLRTSSEGNLFLSPYSISTALGMTYGGARGDTEKQMAKVLRFSLDQKQLHPAFARLEATLGEIQKAGKVKLSVANSLWPQKDYKFLDDYIVLIKDNYGTSITPQDYKTAAEPARKTINKWVEGKTQDKIKDLIPSGVLDPMTRLVLVNAIYFKGNWVCQFKADATQKAPFFLPADKSVEVQLMNQKNKFRYAQTDSEQVLELPYAGNQLSMLVLLSKDKAGLAGLEKAITVENIAKWSAALRKQEVIVSLPKFKMTSQFTLNKALVEMGMTDAFSNKADFSGMDGTKDLFISAAIHEAFVELNEEGTEAAAATAVVAELKCEVKETPPVIFRADHPFVFLIRENKTGSILFIGRVVDPR